MDEETQTTTTRTKVILVTGASSGIGRATALEFAKLGHHLAITGRNSARLEETLAELITITSKGRSYCPNLADWHLAIQADFEHDEQVDLVIPRVIDHFKRLDVLINNAGFAGESLELLDENFYADFQRVLQVNLLASVRLSQLAAPYLINHTLEHPGLLINVSSICDRVPLKALAYCVSKAGLSMLTKTIANSLESQPVRVLAVAPGPVSTSIQQDERIIDYSGSHATLLHRSGQALEVANLIVFLASNKASFMHGSTIDIDGGHIAKLGQLATEGLEAHLRR